MAICVAGAPRPVRGSNPAKYAPQYGGFCSWGVGAANRLFDVDPVNGWTIYDGKLYLNFNADINKSFNKNPSALITKANHNWPALEPIARRTRARPRGRARFQSLSE